MKFNRSVRIYATFWLLTGMIIISSCGFTQPAGDKITAAVIDMQSGEGVSSGTAMTLSDYLRTQLVNTGKFTIVNRENMESILKEQKFQMTGFTEKDVAQAGKLLGVNKVFIGSIGKVGTTYLINLKIVDVQSGKIEKAETEECGSENQLLQGIRNLANKMSGLPSQPLPSVTPQSAQALAPSPPPTYTTPMYTPQPSQVYTLPSPPSRNVYTFIDLFYIADMPEMNLKFENSVYYENASDFAITGVPSSFTSIEWRDMGAKQKIPVALRLGFVNYYFGFGMELFYFSYSSLKGECTYKVDNGAESSFDWYVDDYFQASSFGYMVDFMLNIPIEIIDLYVGGGIGLTLSSYYAPHIQGYTSSSSFTAPSEETALLGFCYRLPIIGTHIRFSPEFGAIIEATYFENSFNFDRSIKYEDDLAKIGGWQILLGVSFFIK